MNAQQFSNIKIYFVGFVTLAIWSILVWQYLHDGVPNHHLLQRADFPAISNWWGAILLPSLSYILLSRIEKRLLKLPPEKTILFSKKTFICFLISLVYGAFIAISFITGYSNISSVMFPSILLFAIFFKVYREEFILGFILSMSLTFGAVLPTIFASVIALLSAIVYFFVQFIWLRVKK